MLEIYSYNKELYIYKVTYSHPALLYITWGLIWDLKNKIQRDPN